MIACLCALRLNRFDAFIGVNVLLFVGLAATHYWRRFLQFRTEANLPEFIVYAGFILAGISVVWIALRRFHFKKSVLALVQVGILLHFTAGLVHADGTRLYDLPLGIDVFDYPLRIDKVVHLFNAFVGCLAVAEVFRVLSVQAGRLTVPLIGASVLALGTLIELCEYIVLKIIPHHGVGDYDNNMTDLAANLLGCIVFAVYTFVRRAAVTKHAKSDARRQAAMRR